MTPFHEYLAGTATDREGRVPYILALSKERTLRRLGVSAEIVQLAEERQQFWSQLRQLAGLEVAPVVRDLVATSLEAEFEKQTSVSAETNRATSSMWPCVSSPTHPSPSQIARVTPSHRAKARS